VIVSILPYFCSNSWQTTACLVFKRTKCKFYTRGLVGAGSASSLAIIAITMARANNGNRMPPDDDVPAGSAISVISGSVKVPANEVVAKVSATKAVDAILKILTVFS
jgi:hypothetical protein